MSKPNLKTAADFIAFFEAIPARKWCRFVLQDDHGRRCANGHLNSAEKGGGTGSWGQTTVLVERLASVLRRSVVPINNGDDSTYKQRSARDRVLAALHDAQKEGR